MEAVVCLQNPANKYNATKNLKPHCLDVLCEGNHRTDGVPWREDR